LPVSAASRLAVMGVAEEGMSGNKNQGLYHRSSKPGFLSLNTI